MDVRERSTVNDSSSSNWMACCIASAASSMSSGRGVFTFAAQPYLRLSPLLCLHFTLMGLTFTVMQTTSACCSILYSDSHHIIHTQLIASVSTECFVVTVCEPVTSVSVCEADLAVCVSLVSSFCPTSSTSQYLHFQIVCVFIWYVSPVAVEDGSTRTRRRHTLAFSSSCPASTPAAIS